MYPSIKRIFSSLDANDACAGEQGEERVVVDIDFA